MTFKEIFYGWMEEKAKSVKPATIRTYGILAERHVLPVLGELESVSREDVDRLLEALREKGMSQKTSFDCSNLVKTVLNYAARKGWCHMPVWTIEGQHGRVKRGLAVLSLEEERKLLDYLRSDRSTRSIGLYLAVTTGVTLKEMCDLTWQDIDFDNQVLHVRDAIRSTEGSTRDIPLAAEQLRFLEAEKGAHLPHTFIVNNGERPADVSTLRLHTKGVFRKLGLDGHQFKDLRDSFAVRLVEIGCDLFNLAALLGNTDYDNLVKTYGPYARRTARTDMERMMNLLAGGER